MYLLEQVAPPTCRYLTAMKTLQVPWGNIAENQTSQPPVAAKAIFIQIEQFNGGWYERQPASSSCHVAINQSLSQTLQDQCIGSDPRNRIFMGTREGGCSRPEACAGDPPVVVVGIKGFHGDAGYFKPVCGMEWLITSSMDVYNDQAQPHTQKLIFLQISITQHIVYWNPPQSTIPYIHRLLLIHGLVGSTQFKISLTRSHLNTLFVGFVPVYYKTRKLFFGNFITIWNIGCS